MLVYLLTAGLIVVTAVTVMVYFLNIKIIPMVVVGVLLAFGLNPLVYNVGVNIARDQASTFHEYWNGFETSADKRVTTCTRDGMCYHTYDCDPYQVTVTRSRTVTGSNGKTHTQTYTEEETHYHSCPYSTQETSYYVGSTVQKFTIASHLMTGNPWRSSLHGIPGGKQSDPGSWVAVKARIAANAPGPVTVVKNYQNFILASQYSTLKSYSDKIDDLKSKNLLPNPSTGVFDTYQASKVYKVGTAKVTLLSQFVKDLSYMNGAVGTDLRGDLHVVFVPENINYGKDDYATALMSYWQSPELKRNAISKNSIVVVVGVPADGSKVSWAKAMTGMPVGNEAMLTEMESTLKDAPINAKLIGHPSYNLKTGKVMHSDGLIEGVLWGTHKFARVSMTANGANDNGSGFSYLKDQISLSGWAIFWIALVNLVATGGVLVILFWMIRSEILANITGFEKRKVRF